LPQQYQIDELTKGPLYDRRYGVAELILRPVRTSSASAPFRYVALALAGLIAQVRATRRLHESLRSAWGGAASPAGPSGVTAGPDPWRPSTGPIVVLSIAFSP